MHLRLLPALSVFAALCAAACTGPGAVPAEEKSTAKAVPTAATGDWPMYGGTPARNMVNTLAKDIPTEWGTKAGEKNIKWVQEIGKDGGRYLPPAIAGGQIYVATNNRKPRNPSVKGDKAVLMCFRESDGQFLWQLVHDVETLVAAMAGGEGLLSTPVVEGERLYYVTPDANVICASTKGKVLWHYDMLKELKVVLHAAAFCSPLVVGDRVFCLTGNGKPYPFEPEKPVPEPKAPSFVAFDKKTGKLVWQDNSPGDKIMEGTWASPAYAEINGKGQVIFPGGDGWLYAFEPKGDGKLIWKFDCNPKGSVFRTDTRGTRNYLMAPAVVANRLYTAVGQQPDNNAGVGHLWCVDITKLGDVSEELEPGKANPNSGLVWKYGGKAPDGADRDYTFGRSISTCAIHDGLVYAAETDGFLHCLDAANGKELWQEDLKSSIWASPLWVDGKVYLPTENGNMNIFAHGKEKKLLGKIEMDEGIKAAPVVANGVLYLLTDKRLFAIAKR